MNLLRIQLLFVDLDWKGKWISLLKGIYDLLERGEPKDLKVLCCMDIADRMVDVEPQGREHTSGVFIHSHSPQ